jgi:hypothetical protein
MSASSFLEGILKDARERALTSYAERLHAKAASMVDPDTGKHMPIFLRRMGQTQWSLHTNGSPTFARALEQRLGLDKGDIHAMNEPAPRERLVYLAHAWEDKALVKPLAEGLMQRGIGVWYDTWEIGYGDSLRRKMEQGLGDCTHFVVLLTKTSIEKPWVNEEIDVGLLNAVEGSAKFIGLRHELPLAQTPPFLKTRLTPEFLPGEAGLEALAAEIYGVSKKPPLGDKPRYVLAHKPGSTWSASARVVAEYFVRNSADASLGDPQADFETIQAETGLPAPDVRIGVLDLVGAGLMEREDYFGGDSSLTPTQDLFVVFDADFMDWDPERDARDLAIHWNNAGGGQGHAAEAAQALGWPARRFNPAAAYLVSARVIKPIEYMGGNEGFWPPAFELGDELLRFVRSL